ncbi:hypothetical protein BVH74_09870 [Halopseudomonas phragmitis]|uniref:BLUF domain-containing protein n=3 Tax=Pseudomonadales TaxID=72274 RepID=A0A1V0B527_9GAMM|nr:hypothetical protein BVH74_09870 [Halopseudomonas phragmitis]RHW21833.1 blue light sensor protein [Pseudomonas jilinensis]
MLLSCNTTRCTRLFMTELVRIVYISRATFSPAPNIDGIDPTVARILISARLNNARQGIVGLLYYADGCFIQCLEGERDKVHALYRTLLKDRRHTELKLLVSEPIARLAFPDWSMKYAPADQHMQRLLQEHGFERFDPYRFDHHLTERALQLLQGLPDPTDNGHERNASAPARGLQLGGVLPMQGFSASGPTRGNSGLALIMSMTALLVSLLVLAMELGWL